YSHSFTHYIVSLSRKSSTCLVNSSKFINPDSENSAKDFSICCPDSAENGNFRENVLHSTL
ncbi:MAG: hypothetical protein J7K33_11200, partial [Candidatus Marinimicrobia bacterium]|nr:hypothetical protein [Candidatus Neomarinimicrobiota bacterium]